VPRRERDLVHTDRTVGNPFRRQRHRKRGCKKITVRQRLICGVLLYVVMGITMGHLRKDQGEMNRSAYRVFDPYVSFYSGSPVVPSHRIRSTLPLARHGSPDASPIFELETSTEL
jgi:hypothetical protein